MKVLFVGFQPYENITYPHLKQVVQHFSTLGGGGYALFRERGYFLDESFRPRLSIKAWLRAVYTFGAIAVDSLRLINRCVMNKYDLVVAVDNFAFIVASALFKNVVLWSHDFVTNDQERSHTWIHRLIKRKVSTCMDNKANIIIQDETRLGLFSDRYIRASQIHINAFFLPVSLTPSATESGTKVRAKPTLLQIGGINAWRSMSDKLLGHYQIYHADYELALHGFIDKDMAQRIRHANILPWASSIDLDAECVFKIVEKCDIGFIAYNANDLNFYYIAKASGQLVEYLRCAKPVIVLGNTDLRRLVEEKEIGVAIDEIEALSDAIKKVVSRYSYYSSACTKLYNEEYNLTSYIDPLSEWLIQRTNT